MTGMTADDIVNALDLCGFLHKQPDGSYSIGYDIKILEAYLEKVAAKKLARVNASKLRWTPHVWSQRGVVAPTEPATEAAGPEDEGEGEGEGEDGDVGSGQEVEEGEGEAEGEEGGPSGSNKDEDEEMEDA